MTNTPEHPTLVLNLGGLSGTGKTSTANEIVRYYRTWKDVSATLFRPSELIRTYATTHSLQLNQRSDYQRVHEIMEAEDPHFITNRVERLVANYGVVTIDGLRKYSHAKALKDAFSNPDSLVTYRTSLLAARDSVRHSRVLSDAKRSNRSENVPQSLDLFIESELPEIQSPYYEIPKVWAMSDTPETAIDTSDITPWEAAKIIISAVRQNVPGTLIRA